MASCGEGANALGFLNTVSGGSCEEVDFEGDRQQKLASSHSHPVSTG